MNLPKWANYTTKDKWGRLWAYSHEPSLKTYGKHEIWAAKDVQGSRMAMLSFGSIPDEWRKTLVKIHENRL